MKKLILSIIILNLYALEIKEAVICKKIERKNPLYGKLKIKPPLI